MLLDLAGAYELVPTLATNGSHVIELPFQITPAGHLQRQSG